MATSQLGGTKIMETTRVLKTKLDPTLKILPLPRKIFIDINNP